MKTKTMKASVFTLACILILAGSAFAGTATSNMSVTATITANCTIDATGGLAFGAYDPIVTNATNPLNGSGTISVVCTNGSPATITLDQGLNPAGGSTNAAPLRQMASGGNNLAYFLYQDGANSIVWGNTTGVGGTGAAYNGTGVSTNVTVFGQVPAGQNVPAGSYSDTVVATITF